MQRQAEPNREFPESEKGFEQDRDKQREGTGSGQQQDRGTTGTGTATGTAPQNPGTERQNPGTQQDQSITQDAPIRNPSGDDLSEGIEGDEGSGRGL